MRYNLSEINLLIRNRRTIYPEQFTDRKVHKEQIDLILQNAQWAPTHGNTQPWRFHVFLDQGKEKLSQFLGETYLKQTPKDLQSDVKFAKLVRRPLLASVVIAVSMKRQSDQKIMEIEEIQAVACAIQNMHLTATAYGLGAFWSTPKLIYTDDMLAFLGLEENDKCLGLFYLGYPAIEWPQAHRIPLEYHTQWIHE